MTLETGPHGDSILPMPDPVICTECGQVIDDIREAVEMTPFGAKTRQFAHKPIPGCPKAKDVE